MILYHFTKRDKDHIGSILRDQQIEIRHWFPNPHNSIHSIPLVWLTDDPFPHRHRWATDRRVRITVDLPKSHVTRWLDFARQKNLHSAYEKSLDAGTPSMWWIAQESIPRTNWIEIALLDDNGYEHEIIQIKPYV